MVIIAVLGALAIIMLLVTQLSGDAVYAARFSGTLLEREKAYYQAQSVMNALPRLFMLDDDSFDALSDVWATRIPTIPVEGGKIGVSIDDEERRFDISSIVDKAGNVEEKHLGQLHRLLKMLEINPDFSNAVLDWMDRDEERRFPGGAEGSDYVRYPCKNSPLDSLEELLLIKGCQKEDFLGRVARDRPIPGLKDVLSLHSGGKVNINTASEFVLKSLDDELGEETVQEIMRRRTNTPFKKMEDLLKVSGFNYDLLYRIRDLADVKSKYYRISCRSEAGMTTLLLTVIAERGADKFKPVFWKVE